MQLETGKVRGEAAGESGLPLWTDLINFYEQRRPGSTSGRSRVSAHSPLMKVKQAQGPVYRPYPRGGRDQPVELPADPLARRRDPGPDRRLRRRHQAVGVHFRWTRWELVRAWKEEIGATGRPSTSSRAWARAGGALVDACDFIQFTGSERTGEGRP